MTENTELPQGQTVKIPELSVVMPAYNVEQALPRTLSEAVESLDRMCGDWELIAIDDGSTDGTGAVLREVAAEEPRIRVLGQPGTLGYGVAMRRGFDAARFLVVGTTAADGQFDLSDYSRLYPLLRSAHVATGYRILEGASKRRGVSARIVHRMIRSSLGLSARDMDCALRLYRRSLFHMIELAADRYLCHPELLARTARAGLEWAEAEVSHDPARATASEVPLFGALKELRELKKSLS